MSKCWKCNKEFYSEYLSQTLCDECLGRIPRATATTDFAKIEIAEKDKVIEGLEEINKSLGQTCNNDLKEIDRLNKLIAEKEKGFNWIYSKWQKCVQNHNQDKIEFAIEQLEKLVEKTLLFAITINAPWKTMRCVNAEKIENLIEELKEKINENICR